MLEDFFFIPASKIDENWLPIEKGAYEFFCLEYCEEVLDIPLLFIEEVNYENQGLEIMLKSLNNEIAQDDWYIQLHRLSSYARAS